jgi:spermidine/putrescine transport system permease protein
MKAQARPSVDPAALGGGALLVLLYIFLYAPIFYVIYTSFAEDIVWPFPPSFSLTSYEDLFASSLYAKALSNSVILGIGTAILSTVLATGGAIGILRYRARCRSSSPTC